MAPTRIGLAATVAALALALPLPASADILPPAGMSPDAANAAEPAARTNLLPSPNAGALLVGSGSDWVSRAVNGDCTMSGTGALVCTRTNGAAFSAIATSGSADDLGSGTMSALRLPTHIELGGSAPSPESNCGTGAGVAGNDAAGRVTLGSGPGGYCMLDFAASWTNTAVCMVANETSGSRGVYPQPQSAKLAIVAISGSLTAGDVLSFKCWGYR